MAKDTIWDGGAGDNVFLTAGNWDNGPPVSTDSVFFRAITAASGVNVAGDVDQSAILLVDFNVEAKCGVIFGSRETPLHIDTDNLDYRGSGAGGNIEVDNSTLVRVFDIGSPGSDWTFGLNLHGASNTKLEVEIPSSDHLAVAGHDDDTAAFTTIIHRSGTLTIGEGVAVAELFVEGGTVNNHSAISGVLWQSGGTVNHFAGAIATIDGSGGVLNHYSTSLYTTAEVRAGFTLDFTKDGQSRDISAKATNLYKGGKIKLIANRLTWGSVFVPQADVTQISAT